MKNLSEKFFSEIRPKLQKEFGLKNLLEVPQLVKIVVAMGIKEGAGDKSVIEKAKIHLASITGQSPKVCRAKKSIAAFNLTKGSPIGLMVTLRGKMMYDFSDKLFNIVLSRTRDFRGVPLSGFDKNGNYTLGIGEIIVFSEVDYAQLDKTRGLEVTFVIKTKNINSSKKLLEELGMPFQKS